MGSTICAPLFTFKATNIFMGEVVAEGESRSWSEIYADGRQAAENFAAGTHSTLKVEYFCRTDKEIREGRPGSQLSTGFLVSFGKVDQVSWACDDEPVHVDPNPTCRLYG